MLLYTLSSEACLHSRLNKPESYAALCKGQTSRNEIMMALGGRSSPFRFMQVESPTSFSLTFSGNGLNSVAASFGYRVECSTDNLYQYTTY